MPAKRGRPRKYATAEQAKEANRLNAAKRQRRAKEAQDLVAILLHERTDRAPDRVPDSAQPYRHESTNAGN